MSFRTHFGAPFDAILVLPRRDENHADSDYPQAIVEFVLGPVKLFDS